MGRLSATQRADDKRRARAVYRLLKATVRAYLDHDMSDRAASLTYFGMMSVFPALLLIISLTVLIGDQSIATNAATYLLDHGADKTTANTVHDALHTMLDRSRRSAAGVTLVIGFGLTINGASAAFAAAGRALNVIHGIEEHRPFWERKLADITWTLIVILLFFITLVAATLGGTLAHDIFATTLGLGNEAGDLWRTARWPLAVFAFVAAFDIVYAFAPDIEARRRRYFSPGLLVAVSMWLLTSLGLSVYVSNFSSYGAAYGAFGAAVVILLWLYVSANAFLFGAELDKVIELSKPPKKTPR